MAAKVSTRDSRLDLLRLFAIAGVICIHAVDAMFPSITTGAPLDPAMLARIPDAGALDLYAAIRTCCYGFNIVYIMISGALLMRWKDEPLKDFYLKRVSKVLLPLLIYYFFYQWQNGLLFPLSASRIAGIFRGFFTADIELCPFYWLIYIIISLYLIYPFMRHMMKDLPYPALTVLAAGIAIFSGLVAYTPFVFAPVIGFWLGYAILGYWVTRPESRRFDWFLLIFGALQAVVIYLLIRRSTLDGTGYGGYMGLVTPYTPIMVFLCLGYFAFIYRLPARLFSDVRDARPKAAADIRSRFLRFFSKYSFSAILVHWWVLYFILGRFYPQTAAAASASASANAAGIFRSLFSTGGIFHSFFLSGGIFRMIYDTLLNVTGTHLALIWLVAADLVLSVLIGALLEEYVLKAPLWLWDKLCSAASRRP
ncbi:MAG: acyltransferase family protein [Lachnospiraceae bacterium]|nr:acyltransferase family protein [Lachnospiraceae bacterium]